MLVTETSVRIEDIRELQHLKNFTCHDTLTFRTTPIQRNFDSNRKEMAYNRKMRAEWTSNPGACTVELALASIGGKWKLRIYDVIRREQPVRYCLLNNQLGDISEKTLTAQLREMEQDGIIIRIVYPEVPPRVEYKLTALGESLQTVFDALNHWGKAYADDKNARQAIAS